MSHVIDAGDFRVPSEVAGSTGKQFEDHIVNLHPKLRKWRQVPPPLESDYSIGANREREPIVDTYIQINQRERKLIEIKKGWAWHQRKRYLMTSRQQMRTLAYGVNYDGVRYTNGEYWVFQKLQGNPRNRYVKFKVWIIKNFLVESMFRTWDDRTATLPNRYYT